MTTSSDSTDIEHEWAVIHALTEKMWANSERWYPRWHSPELPMPLPVAYALGMVGEAGEVANVIKKMYRDDKVDDNITRANAAEEIADTFTYLLLLAKSLNLDLLDAFYNKMDVIERNRFGPVRVGSRWIGPSGIPMTVQQVKDGQALLGYAHDPSDCAWESVEDVIRVFKPSKF